MGNRGHLDKQQRARELRAQAWTLDEIAAELGCAKSSASLWTRGVEFTPSPAIAASVSRSRHPMHLAKLAEIEECRRWAAEALGNMSERDLFMAGIGLYAGDGAKTGNEVRFANSNPDLIRLFCRWFRQFFDIDESRPSASRCTCTWGSTSMQRTQRGPTSRAFPSRSSTSRGGPCQTRRSGTTSTSTVARTYGTHVPATQRRIRGLLEALVSLMDRLPG